MKVKKTTFIVLLCLAVVFLVTGAVLLLLPRGESPIAMSENIRVIKSGSNYRWGGKLKNVTDKDITLTSYDFTVEVDTRGNYINVYAEDYWFCDDNGKRGKITLKPNEEFDLSTEEFNTGGETPTNVLKASVVVNGKKYYLVGGSDSMKTFAVLAFIVAVIFGIAAIANIVTNVKQAKHAKAVGDIIGSMPGGGAYLDGFYGEKNGNKKAAAKSVFSILGGAISSLFLGVGFYKVYSGSTPKEFILTDDELYVGDPKSKNVGLDCMNRLSREQLSGSFVTSDKKCVTLTNSAGTQFYSFTLKNSTLGKDELVSRLEKLAAEQPVEPEPTPDAAPDPFN